MRLHSLDEAWPARHLQGLLDFCNQPGFIRNVYLNLDCRVERGNLFESVAALLSKTAFPVSTALGTVHLLSLEGLFAILSGLSAGCAWHCAAALPALVPWAGQAWAA